MRTLVVLGIVAALVTPVLATEYITNGTFNAGAGMTGWTYDFAWGKSAGLSNNTSAHPWGPSDQSHDNVCELDIGDNMDGARWIYQVVTGLTVGQQYTISGMVAGGIGGAQAMSNTGSAWWQFGYRPGAYSKTNIDSGSGCVNVTSFNVAWTGGTGNWGGGSNWVSNSAQFTATNTTYTIYYKYGASGSNWQYYGVYGDNFSLTPEPAALTLMLLGLPMLRRRR